MHEPTLAQLVERRTVVVAVILRSLVRIRQVGCFFSRLLLLGLESFSYWAFTSSAQPYVSTLGPTERLGSWINHGPKISSAHPGSISNTISPRPIIHAHRVWWVLKEKKKKKTWLRNKIEEETQQVESISSITESNVVDVVGVEPN